MVIPGRFCVSCLIALFFPIDMAAPFLNSIALKKIIIMRHPGNKVHTSFCRFLCCTVHYFFVFLPLFSVSCRKRFDFGSKIWARIAFVLVIIWELLKKSLTPQHVRRLIKIRLKVKSLSSLSFDSQWLIFFIAIAAPELSEDTVPKLVGIANLLKVTA